MIEIDKFVLFMHRISQYFRKENNQYFPNNMNNNNNNYNNNNNNWNNRDSAPAPRDPYAPVQNRDPNAFQPENQPPRFAKDNSFMDFMKTEGPSAINQWNKESADMRDRNNQNNNI